MEAEDTPPMVTEIKKEADEYWVTVVKVSLHSHVTSFCFSRRQEF